jgi:hypothetical protein
MCGEILDQAHGRELLCDEPAHTVDGQLATARLTDRGGNLRIVARRGQLADDKVQQFRDL